MPTITNLRIRDVRDAEIIFHAVALGILPMRIKRLNDDEKASLRSGHVYVWPHGYTDPLGGSTGDIQRFTEGRSWGPSKARDSFLLYYEKGEPAKPSIPYLGARLIKLTYSVHVNSPDGQRKKWHLNAYFIEATHDRLETVDDVPALRSVDPPRGRYICARASGTRRPSARDQQDADGNEGADDEQGPGDMRPPSSPCRAEATANASADSASGSAAASGSGSTYVRLAPLEYLQNSTPRPRYPVDEELLRSLHRCAL